MNLEARNEDVHVENMNLTAENQRLREELGKMMKESI